MKISQHKYFKHLEMVQIGITNATTKDFESFLSKCESIVGKAILKRHIKEDDVDMQEYVKDDFTVSYLKNQGQIVAQYIGNDSDFFEKLGFSYPNDFIEEKRQLERTLVEYCSKMNAQQIDDFWFSCDWIDEDRGKNKSLPQNVIDKMMTDKEYLKNRIKTLIQETGTSNIKNLVNLTS